MRTLEDLRSCNQYAAPRAREIEELIEKYASDVVEATQAGSAVADRLRIEIMDHLTEAMEDVAEADRAEMDPVARLRAVINDFGPQEVMAGDYREVIAESRWRHLRWTVVAGIGLTFLAMRIRPYILEPGWREDLMQSSWGSVMMFVDRYAFLIAILVVLGGLMLDRLRCLPGISAPRMSSQTVFRVLCTATVPAVMVLMSALAGIGALLYPLLSNGGLRDFGLEWLTIAALALLCSVLTRNLVILMRRCRPILLG